MKWSTENKIRFGFGSGLVFLLLTSSVAYWSANRSLGAFREVEVSERTMDLLRETLVASLDVETGTRGFMITEQRRFLSPFTEGRARLAELVPALRNATTNDVRQQAALARLSPLLDRAISNDVALIHARSAGQTNWAAYESARGGGKETMDAIRARIGRMERAERRLLAEQSADARATFRAMTVVLSGSGALALLAVAMASAMAHRDFARRRRVEAERDRLDADLQRQAAALSASEERIRMMVEGVKDYAIILLDAGGRVVNWNAGAERIKGYRAEEIIGQHFSRFYPAADAQGGKPQRALAAAAAGGRFEEQALRVRKDGAPFWASVLVTALRDAHGRLRGFVKITRDITESKRAEEEIVKLNGDLRRRAAQLQEANRELEAFSYSVSHDLRAPLRHIDGFVARLDKTAGGALDEKGRHYLKIISDSARHMGNLIDDLLVFSRMGRAEMRELPVDLEALVREVTAQLQPEIQQRCVAWKNGGLPRVHGDPAMLRQVLVNLMSNAVKYTRTRERAEIEIGSTAAAEEFVVFVRDNGVGFDMQYAHKLFGVFQRLHRADEFEGTGIGLANVRRIIQRHGGRTWAEGKVNGGATFYFSLPKTRKDSA